MSPASLSSLARRAARAARERGEQHMMRASWVAAALRATRERDVLRVGRIMPAPPRWLRVRHASLASSVVLALLLWCSHGHAQGDAIRLELDDCEDVPGTSVRDLVVLEVAPRPVLAHGSTEPAATRAELICEAGVAAIVVEEMDHSATLRLELTLSDLARSARPRGLALAVAELIATSRLQRRKPTAAETEVDPPAPAADEQPSYEVPNEPTRSGLQLWLGVGAARMAQPSLFGPVGALGVVGYWGAFALTSDLRFEYAQTSQGVAELLLNAGSLALAPAWRLHASSADLLVGAGVRAGFATLSGKSSDPTLTADSVTGFWVAPAVQVAVHVRLTRSWALRVGVEGAYVTRTLRGLGADGEAVLELRGLSLAAVVGISWALSGSE